MDEHFRTCSACRSLLEGTRNVIQLYSDERMIEVPSGFGSRLQHRLAQSRRTPGRNWSPWSAWLVPLAALLLITGGVRIASSRTVPHPLLSEHAQPGRDIPPDMVVVVSADAKEFHVPGCEFIHNKDQRKNADGQRSRSSRDMCPACGVCESICRRRARAGPRSKWKQLRNQTSPARSRMGESEANHGNSHGVN